MPTHHHPAPAPAPAPALAQAVTVLAAPGAARVINSIGMDEGEHTQTVRGVVIVALVIVALAAAGVLVYLLLSPRQPENRYADVTVNTVLRQENHDFVTGLSYLKIKDFDKALSSFEAALTHASDAWQEGLISYYIGLAKEKLGRYAGAIEAYKAVATNTDYYPIIRAYAAQQIGIMYQVYYDAQPAIAAATFTGDPFASFKQEGDNEGKGYDASYMRLFEYAASIHPLALSESYVASMYAIDLHDRLKRATTTAEGRVAMQRTVAALQAIDADFARLARNPDEAAFIAGVYLREAIAKTYLILSGVPGYTNEDVNSLYLKALAAAASTGQPPGNFIAWLYGNFLDRMYGKSRIADMEKALAPFSVNNTENISPLIPPYFKSLATNPAYGHHKSAVVRAAALVPTFKAYLVSLGWHASDFAGT